MIEFYKNVLRSASPDSILPDEFCCKLLALVYCYTTEETVFNPRMKAEIQQAAFQLGCCDGGQPKHTAEIRRYVSEIQTGTADWLVELDERYSLNLNNEMMEKADVLTPPWKENHDKNTA